MALERLKRRAITTTLNAFWKLGLRLDVFGGSGRPSTAIDATALSYDPHSDRSFSTSHRPDPRPHLRSLLRRFPYWPEGHLELGTLSLAANDISETYASAHCARHCSGANPTLLTRALVLLGSSYLRRGNADAALLQFNEARSVGGFDSSLDGEEAAALMALGRNDAARRILESIPVTTRTPEASAALDYLMKSGDREASSADRG